MPVGTPTELCCTQQLCVVPVGTPTELCCTTVMCSAYHYQTSLSNCGITNLRSQINVTRNAVLCLMETTSTEAVSSGWEHTTVMCSAYHLFCHRIVTCLCSSTTRTTNFTSHKVVSCRYFTFHKRTTTLNLTWFMCDCCATQRG